MHHKSNVYSTAKVMLENAITEGGCSLPANSLRSKSVTEELPSAGSVRGPDVLYMQRETAENRVCCMVDERLPLLLLG